MTIDLKRKIISTATVLFMEQGYSATSTREIAKILEISQPAIYHHFKNKEEIFVNVLLEFANEVGVHLYSKLNQDIPKRDILVNMSSYLIDNHNMNFSLIMSDLSKEIGHQNYQDIFKVWHKNYFSPFIDFFESINQYLIDDFNATLSSQHFLRMLSAYLTNTPKKSTLDMLKIDDIVNIFLRGVTGESFDILIK